MATFINTTLTRRTGATTTVFVPATISSKGVGELVASSAYAGQGPSIKVSSSRETNVRRTKVRITVPQLDGETPPTVLARPYAELSLVIPDGTLQSDIDDLVGYLNAATASSLTNFDDILVEGVGVY